MLPKRFEGASFENFEPDPAFPVQAGAVSRITDLISQSEPPRSRLPWKRKSPESNGPRGLYLDGPPGIGKTHLLAAAFQSAPEPKLFATFDEFVAAAGTLGMRRLRHLLASRRLVCIDEVDLRDPGNIMLLTSLMRAMLAGEPRVLATANADPTGMSNGKSFAEDFGRELGEIASAFQILRVDGVDWREAGLSGERRDDRLARDGELRVAQFTFEALADFLYETHPMYDAAWLQEVDLIELDRIEPLPNTDRALRFVRFVDRVYDRDVSLATGQMREALEDVLAPLRDDRRFVLHFARCRSRLIELVSSPLADVI
ncbi:MAG: cell division protein ZapE [Hyphomicrobiales bacterium]|nr:cell division protein ZapE [Hyphomicrobiales bacterium]